MDAGRELDARIAVEIFDYTLDYEFADQRSDGAPCVLELRDQYDEWGMLPHYSTDIGDAWLVVEHLQARYDCLISVSALPNFMARRGKYSCVVIGGNLPYLTPSLTLPAYGPTAPLAVCRAALEASQAEQDGSGDTT